MPVLALLLLAFAVGFVSRTRQPVVGAVSAPVIPPAVSPFAGTIAAAGVVEPHTENIEIGAAVPGVVEEVLVEVGDPVHPGTPLFRLDDRHLRAELEVRRAAAEAARQDLERLKSLPRPEEIPIKESQVEEAQANIERQAFELERVRELFEKESATDDELERAEKTYAVAVAQLKGAQAARDLLRAGSWEYDRAVAAAALAQAQARVRQAETELERMVVAARVVGDVLQINVRPGEYVAAPSPEPAVVVGDVRRLYVRADVDEYDIPRFQMNARAYACPKGSSHRKMPLRFVRVEPYVIPKRALTGEPMERVDTRVLQVMYEVELDDIELYVGQQLDVFIEAAPRGGDSEPATKGAEPTPAG